MNFDYTYGPGEYIYAIDYISMWLLVIASILVLFCIIGCCRRLCRKAPQAATQAPEEVPSFANAVPPTGQASPPQIFYPPQSGPGVMPPTAVPQAPSYQPQPYPGQVKFGPPPQMQQQGFVQPSMQQPRFVQLQVQQPRYVQAGAAQPPRYVPPGFVQAPPPPSVQPGTQRPGAGPLPRAQQPQYVQQPTFFQAGGQVMPAQPAGAAVVQSTQAASGQRGPQQAQFESMPQFRPAPTPQLASQAASVAGGQRGPHQPQFEAMPQFSAVPTPLLASQAGATPTTVQPVQFVHPMPTAPPQSTVSAGPQVPTFHGQPRVGVPRMASAARPQ